MDRDKLPEIGVNVNGDMQYLKDQIDSGSCQLELKLLGLVDLPESLETALFKLTVACPQSYKSRDQREFQVKRDLEYKGDRHKVYRPAKKEEF